MHRFKASLAGAALACVISAPPALAASPAAAPAVTASGQYTTVQKVSDRHWRHHHRHRDSWRPGSFGLGFALGFGAPYFGSYAHHPAYIYPEYPYGYSYAPPYYETYPAYPYGYGEPHLPLDYREK
jgi:hypothetical protein